MQLSSKFTYHVKGLEFDILTPQNLPAKPKQTNRQTNHLKPCRGDESKSELISSRERDRAMNALERMEIMTRAADKYAAFVLL